jgi:SAM-dependent methyltransferase
VEQSERDVRLLYETHARACDPQDFQGQVMRTPHGKPVGEDQVTLIVDGTLKGLDLESGDFLLDLCCGNGAITDRLFARCKGGIGVDFTPYLIEVAKANFERPPQRVFRLADALEYVETTDHPERFNKVMCYGAFQCLPESKGRSLLCLLRQRFPNVHRVFLGNLPDLDRVELFCRHGMGSEPWPHSVLKRHDTLFGIWRDEKEITELADECGWRAQISRMPPSYYSAYFRFDAILTRF